MSDATRLICDELNFAMQRYIKATSPESKDFSRQQLAPYIFDMETGDPDDVLTLLFLCAHPDVELRAVTIYPGTQDQVGLVRWILQQLGLVHVRLGACARAKKKKNNIEFDFSFYQSFGSAPCGKPACERADQVLSECCDESVTLVTGGLLHNLADALQMDDFRLGRWVAQGGFAGKGVVPEEKQNAHTTKEVAHTYNFSNSIPEAQAALSSAAIKRKICVSGNVCHFVTYTKNKWHKQLKAAVKAKANQLAMMSWTMELREVLADVLDDEAIMADDDRGSDNVLDGEATYAPEIRRVLAFAILHHTMDEYICQKKGGGKTLHDPLALAVALDESLCELAEVELFVGSEAGCETHWGSKLSSGSNTWITVDRNDFIEYESFDAKVQAVLALR